MPSDFQELNYPREIAVNAIETDRDMLSPEEEEAIVPTKPTKAVAAAVPPAIMTLLLALGVKIEPEVLAAAATLLEFALVWAVPNRRA